MKIIYPYNEILPLKRAHDAYIVRNCASLAAQGHEVVLLIGKGSMKKKELFEFYHISPNNPLKIVELPILRRQNFFRLQCNFIFFWCVQHYLEKFKPDCVICSVLKQADFHLTRKIPGVFYIYEVHQILCYPTTKSTVKKDKILLERSILNRSDLITVTTGALKQLLMQVPYEISTPIEKIPLACDFHPLKKKGLSKVPFQLYYVGQLYKAQGLKRLLKALKEVEGIHLNVVGGQPLEIEYYQQFCREEQLMEKISFKGFYSSDRLSEVLEDADAFITPFEGVERMPYVAHTKLYEYQAWKRPILAPAFDIVKEHLQKGVLFFEPDQETSLISALNHIQDPKVYSKLLDEAQRETPFTWEKRGCLFNEVLNRMPIPRK